MKINLTVRNFGLNTDMKSYVEKRLSNLDRFSKHIIKTNLVLEEQRGQFRGELLFDVKRKHLKAEDFSGDFFELIDRLKSKMERQLKKYEEKMKRKK